MLPTLIHIGRFYIATYGVLVAASYLIGILWLKSRIGPMQMTEERFWRMIYCVFFGAVAGGKLLFVLLNWQAFASGRMSLIRDFRFGFVYFGGLSGAVLMGLAYFRWRIGEFMRVGDYFAAVAPLGHAVGRLGCLAAGCCFGRPATVAWAVRFTDPGSLVDPGYLGVPLHPAQLYEAAGNIALFALLRPMLKRAQEGRLHAGSVFCAYVPLYSGLRFVVEFYRGDDRGGFLFGLSPSQWIALGAAAAVSAAAWRSGLWRRKS